MAAGEKNETEASTPQPPTSEGQDGENRKESETPEDINIVMKCALQGNVENFIACFEDEENPFRETVAELMIERNDEGKNPLDVTATLGRVDMLKELITRGVDVNETTPSKGYTALHHAAAWGRITCLKVLIEHGGNLQARTKCNERAREIAIRYSQSECVDYLDWAEAKQTLVDTITTMKETVTDPEKVQGRLSRDEKNSTVALCTEKADWVDATPDATTQDFIAQKQEFDEAVSEVAQKLSEPPPEKPEKK